MSDTRERVRKIIYNCLDGYVGVNFSADYPDESRLVEDLGADSLDTIELMMAFEEEFDIDIEDDEAERWITVSDVVRLIEGKSP